MITTNIITRTYARQHNLQKYFTGKPCKNGHISERFVISCMCCVCSRQYYADNNTKIRKQNQQYYTINKNKNKPRDQLYYKTNRQKILLQKKKQHKLNREQINIKQTQYRKQNAEHIIQRDRVWRRKNPSLISEIGRIRNTMLYKQIPLWIDRNKINTVYTKRNELNEKYTINLEVDHIIPLNPRDRSVCGLHVWDNLQLLDKQLNSSKGSTYETNW